MAARSTKGQLNVANDESHPWVLHINDAGADFEYEMPQLNKIIEALGGDHGIARDELAKSLDFIGQSYLDARRAEMNRPKPGQTAAQLQEVVEKIDRLCELMDTHFFDVINDRSEQPNPHQRQFEPLIIFPLLREFGSAAIRAKEIEHKMVPRKTSMRVFVFEAQCLWEEITDRHAGNVKDFRDFVLSLLKPLDNKIKDEADLCENDPGSPDRVIDYLKELSRTQRRQGNTPGKKRG